MSVKTQEEWRAEWERRRTQQEQRDRIRRVPFIEWPNKGVGWCRWCGEMVIDEKKGGQSKRASWHKDCVAELYLHSRLERQFAFVERRDGLRCAWPDCGDSPERWHQTQWDNHAVSSRWCDVPEFWPAGLFDDIPWAERTTEQRQLGWYKEIERRTALQLDHRVPLWAVVHLPDLERRGYFRPGNLWLLCPDHHKLKTKAEAALRAKVKAGTARVHI